MTVAHITDEHRPQFDAVTSGTFDNIALFSCFVDDEPAVAIVAILPDGDDGDVQITPLFVSITPSKQITDHDGRSA